MYGIRNFFGSWQVLNMEKNIRTELHVLKYLNQDNNNFTMAVPRGGVRRVRRTPPPATGEGPLLHSSSLVGVAVLYAHTVDPRMHVLIAQLLNYLQLIEKRASYVSKLEYSKKTYPAASSVVYSSNFHVFHP